jgi:copper(I)-binding protein
MNTTTRTTRTVTRTITLTALAAAALLTLSACAGTTTAATTEQTPVVTHEADALTLADGWVKAADEGMSAAFGTLENSSGSDITVVSVESPASSAMELHETVENGSGAMVMREKEDGFTIPADGSFELAPGGNHLMLMGLTAPLKAGDEVAFTLTLADGSTLEVTVPAKDYTGANESYEGGDMGDMGGEGDDMQMEMSH